MRKTFLVMLAAIAAVPAFAADGVTNAVPADADSAVRFDAGADLRVRQEIMHNVPGLPGAPGAMMPLAYREAQNHIRYRPRAWGRLDAGDFGLYARIADEMREYVVKNGAKRKRRNYNFPDEMIVDNLFLEGRGLLDDFLDFRVGRQDLFDGAHSVLGLDRLMLDGAPYVGSRSCYADMVRITLHPTETSKLDAFALYDNGRNTLRYGNRLSRGRPMNAIHPGDSPEMDEWGGGLVWNDSVFEGRMPYQLYTVHKHNEAYTSAKGDRVKDKQITTLGVHMMPEITENISLDLDGAQQFGSTSDGSRRAGGTMGYAAIDFHRSREAKGLRPWGRVSAYYLSGDRNRGTGHADTAWDPMWARAPCDSELMQYGTLYGLGYWSNMLYTKLTLGLDVAPQHVVSVYSGPMWAATQDHAGNADDASSFKGVLSAARYAFPLYSSGRFKIFGHLLGEVFNPGDYYSSSRPAYFIRWEVNFRF